MSLDILEEENY